MNYIDVIILLPLVYGAYKGFSRGLIVEMSTLFALVLGVFISLRYAVNMEDFLKDFIAMPESYAYYIAFAVTFLLVIILFIVNAMDNRYEFISVKTKSDSLLYQPFVNFANGVYESAFK